MAYNARIPIHPYISSIRISKYKYKNYPIYSHLTRSDTERYLQAHPNEVIIRWSQNAFAENPNVFYVASFISPSDNTVAHYGITRAQHEQFNGDLDLIVNKNFLGKNYKLGEIGIIPEEMTQNEIHNKKIKMGDKEPGSRSNNNFKEPGSGGRRRSRKSRKHTRRRHKDRRHKGRKHTSRK